jgi:hypothetical protein
MGAAWHPGNHFISGAEVAHFRFNAKTGTVCQSNRDHIRILIASQIASRCHLGAD